MHRQTVFRVMLVVSLLLVASMACAITETFNKAKDVKEGIETVQGIATQIDESGIVETGQAFATEIDESGVQETVQAVATDIVVDPGDIPADVPLMDGYFMLVGSDTEITYSINEEYQVVVDFYRREMVAQGWTETEADIQDTIAQLSYEKPGRTVDILLTEVPFIGTIQVVISLK